MMSQNRWWLGPLETFRSPPLVRKGGKDQKGIEGRRWKRMEEMGETVHFI